MNSCNPSPAGIWYFTMTQTQIDEIDKELQSAKSYKMGVLKVGQSIKEVTTCDLETLQKKGVSYAEIAIKLRELEAVATLASQNAYTEASDTWDNLFTAMRNLEDEMAINQKSQTHLNTVFKPIENEEYIFKMVDQKPIMCPFSFQKDDFGNLINCGQSEKSYGLTITRKATGATLHLTELHSHLIEQHGFFKEGPYRVNPDEICNFFGLGTKQESPNH